MPGRSVFAEVADDDALPEWSDDAAGTDAEVPVPADTVYISDIYCSATTMIAANPDSVVPRMMNATSIRHMDGFNAAYVDGHVKWSREPKYGMWTLAAGD